MKFKIIACPIFSIGAQQLYKLGNDKSAIALIKIGTPAGLLAEILILHPK